MRPVRSGFKLRVSLGCNEPRVIRNFDHLNDSSIRGSTAKLHSVLSQGCAVIVVDLVAVTMALGDFLFAVNLIGPGGFVQNARISAET